MQLTFRAGKYIIISAKECGNSSMSKTKTPEVVETSGAFVYPCSKWYYFTSYPKYRQLPFVYSGTGGRKFQG